MYARGDSTEHGKPIRRSPMFRINWQLARVRPGRLGWRRRLVIPMKLGNGGEGKGPQWEVNATSDEGTEIGDEPKNSRRYSEVADGVTRESEGIA
jgi:hypothetical protein